MSIRMLNQNVEVLNKSAVLHMNINAAKGVYRRFHGFLVDGFEVAKKATLEFLESFRTSIVMGDQPYSEILKIVARTTLRTRSYAYVHQSNEPSDLFMVEIMHMRHKFDVDTSMIEGLVLDHCSWHPEMKRRVKS